MMKYMMMAAALIGLPTLPALAQKAGTTDVRVSAQERQAQEAWWAKRAERRAENRTVACMSMPECMAMPDCMDRHGPEAPAPGSREN